MAYYSSPTCGYNGTGWVFDRCITSYSQSEIKYVVDAWKIAQAPAAIEARLITYDDLTDNLCYEKKNDGTIYSSSSGTTPAWVYNNQYHYWIGSQYRDASKLVWFVHADGFLYHNYVYDDYYDGYVVRPVITISKSSL